MISRAAAVTTLLIAAACCAVHSQDLEPRAYSNSPTGLNFRDTRLVNIGSNRWSFKPEFGISKAIGKWTIELTPAVTLYTDNDNFFGGKTRGQDPLYSVQAGVTYSIARGCWLALNGTYFNGGRSSVDGVENDDRHEGTRWGATLAFPLSRYQSIKLWGSTGFDNHGDHEYDGFGIAWQRRWGAGF